MKQSWYCDWMQKRALKGDDPPARSHVAGCPVCREAMAELRAADDRLRLHPDLVPAMPPPSDLWDRVSSGIEARRPSRFPARPVWAGVGVVAAASLALGFFTTRPRPVRQRMAMAPATSKSQLAEDSRPPAAPSPRPSPLPQQSRKVADSDSTSLSGSRPVAPPVPGTAAGSSVPSARPSDTPLQDSQPEGAAKVRGTSPRFPGETAPRIGAALRRGKSGGKKEAFAAKEWVPPLTLGLPKKPFYTDPADTPSLPIEGRDENRLALRDAGSTEVYNVPQGPAAEQEFALPLGSSAATLPSPPDQIYGKKERYGASKAPFSLDAGLNGQNPSSNREKQKNGASFRSNLKADARSRDRRDGTAPVVKSARPVRKPNGRSEAAASADTPPGGTGAGGFGGGVRGPASDQDAAAAAPAPPSVRAFGNSTADAASDSLSTGPIRSTRGAAPKPSKPESKLRQGALKRPAFLPREEATGEIRENTAIRLQNRIQAERPAGSSREPSDPERAGMAAWKAGRWKEAVAELGRVRNPSSGVLFCAGQAYLRLGRREAAIKSFREALIRDPNYIPARRALDALLRDE